MAILVCVNDPAIKIAEVHEIHTKGLVAFPSAIAISRRTDDREQPRVVSLPQASKHGREEVPLRHCREGSCKLLRLELSPVIKLRISMPLIGTNLNCDRKYWFKYVFVLLLSSHIGRIWLWQFIYSSRVLNIFFVIFVHVLAREITQDAQNLSSVT